MGADYVVLHNNEDWDKKIKRMLNNNKVQVIIEHIGLKTWNKSLRLLDHGGRLITCGATTGSDIEMSLKHLFIKQQSIMGSTMSNANSFVNVQKLIHAKKVKPFVDRIFQLDDISKAHTYLEKRNQHGKVVVNI